MILHVPICFYNIFFTEHNVIELSVKIIAYVLPERVPARERRILMFISNGFGIVSDFEYLLTLAYIQFWYV